LLREALLRYHAGVLAFVRLWRRLKPVQVLRIPLSKQKTAARAVRLFGTCSARLCFAITPGFSPSSASGGGSNPFKSFSFITKTKRQPLGLSGYSGTCSARPLPCYRAGVLAFIRLWRRLKPVQVLRISLSKQKTAARAVRLFGTCSARLCLAITPGFSPSSASGGGSNPFKSYVFHYQNKRQPLGLSFVLVPKVGLEPTHSCPYWILNPARLPIPPLRRF
jgi:hypothetical protein